MTEFFNQWIMLPSNAALSADDSKQVWAYINPQAISRVEYEVSGSPQRPIPVTKVYMQDGKTYTLNHSTATKLRDYLGKNSVDVAWYPSAEGQTP